MTRMLAAVACVVLAGGAAILGLGVTESSDASAAVGTAGPVTVTVTPSVGLTVGQKVGVHVDAPAGTLIYEIAAHLCMPAAGINTNYEFGYQGAFCPNIAVFGGDVEKSAVFASGVGAGDMNDFTIGSGVVKWIDERGYNHSMTCGPGAPCDLVVRVQITGDTVFSSVPICYGDGCGPEPGAPVAAEVPPPAAPAATGDGGAAATDAQKSDKQQGAAGAGSSDGSGGSGGGSDADKGSSTDGDVETAGRSASNTTVSLSDSRGTRVFAAGLIGALCGAGIVLIVAHGRRRMIAGRTS